MRTLAAVMALTALLLAPRSFGAEEEGKAPQFSLERAQGGLITSEDISGHLTILNFWATWCVPCVQEIPHLENAFKKYEAGGLRIIGVNFGQGKAQVARFLGKRPVSYPVALDPDGILSRHFHVSALPFSVLIGADGQTLDKYVGALTEARIERWIQEAAGK